MSVTTTTTMVDLISNENQSSVPFATAGGISTSTVPHQQLSATVHCTQCHPNLDQSKVIHFPNIVPAPEHENRFRELSGLYLDQLSKKIQSWRARKRMTLWKCKVLGEAEESAKPWVVIFCEKKIVSKIKSFFTVSKRREDFHKHNGEPDDLCFSIAVYGQPPREMNAEQWPDVFCSSDTVTADTLCGQVIRVTAGERSQLCTIGGLVEVEQTTNSSTLYGITTAHGLFSDMDEDSPDLTEQSETEGDVDGLEIDQGISDWGERVSILPALGSQETLENLSREVGQIVHFSLDADWALFTLNPGLEKPNLGPNHSTIADVASVKEFKSSQPRPVTMCGNTENAAVGTVLSTSFCILSGSNDWVEVFDLRPSTGQSFKLGDSGSWIVDTETLAVYGHVVSLDIFGEISLVPMETIFANIEKRLDASSVQLPEPQHYLNHSLVSALTRPYIFSLTPIKLQNPWIWDEKRQLYFREMHGEEILIEQNRVYTTSYYQPLPLQREEIKDRIDRGEDTKEIMELEEIFNASDNFEGLEKTIPHMGELDPVVMPESNGSQSDDRKEYNEEREPPTVANNPTTIDIGIAQVPLKGSFIVRPDARKFFVTGRVFKTAWAEPKGSSQPLTASNLNSTLGSYGEVVYHKIRWFVVLRPAKQHCLCLSINAFGNRGVAKSHLQKHHYSVIYSTKDDPGLTDAEYAGEGEDPMLPGIRVRPTSKRNKMHNMSRLCYSRIYTFEHNLKVEEFGTVHEEFISQLIENFDITVQSLSQKDGYTESYAADETYIDPAATSKSVSNSDSKDEYAEEQPTHEEKAELLGQLVQTVKELPVLQREAFQAFLGSLTEEKRTELVDFLALNPDRLPEYTVLNQGQYHEGEDHSSSTKGKEKDERDSHKSKLPSSESRSREGNEYYKPSTSANEKSREDSQNYKPSSYPRTKSREDSQQYKPSSSAREREKSSYSKSSSSGRDKDKTRRHP